eukprot:COSAG04_NODE_9994_length_814_cov_1.316084_2_plen_30_part_01
MRTDGAAEPEVSVVIWLNGCGCGHLSEIAC